MDKVFYSLKVEGNYKPSAASRRIMQDLDVVMRKLNHEFLVVQRKMDVSLVAIGVAIGNVIGLTLGLIVAGL